MKIIYTWSGTLRSCLNLCISESKGETPKDWKGLAQMTRVSDPEQPSLWQAIDLKKSNTCSTSDAFIFDQPMHDLEKAMIATEKYFGIDYS